MPLGYGPVMRILVLDIGGVFYRGWPEPGFWPRWSARTGLSPAQLEAAISHDPEARAARLGQISAAEYYARAGQRLGVAAEELRAMAEAAYLNDYDQVFADFVRGLRAGGVAVSSLTNSLSAEAELKARPALSGLFDHVISSRDVGHGKPDAAIFEALLARLQVGAGEVVFVDDALANVEAARALGFHAVHFRETAQAIADISAFYPTSDSSRR